MHADLQLVKRNPFLRGVVWIVLMLPLVWAGAGGAADGPVGKIEALTGAATIERSGQTIRAGAGTEVFLRDRLSTTADSALEIVFKDGSRVKMAGGTDLEITEYLYSPEEKKRESLLSMVSGKARFVVADLQDFKQKRFRVQTQNSVVGTRDTEFSVWILSELMTKTICLENVIIMTNRQMPGKPVLLTANMVSEVYGVNLPSMPRFATAAERREFLRGVEDEGGGRGQGGKRGKQDEGDKEESGVIPGGPGSPGTPGVAPALPQLAPVLPPPETLPATVRPPTITPLIPTTTRPTVPTTTTTSRPVTLPPPPPPPPPQ